MKITVFTPTYNRAHTLPALYASLRRQTYRNFEWLIVDDGSRDETENLVTGWCRQETGFPIRYVKQTNGGKHRAVNRGVALAEGALFFIVDSDDQLTDHSLQDILHQAASIPEECRHRYAGVCGCKGYSETQITGTTFDGATLDCTSLERASHGIDGDKAEVFFTRILKQYPFPEYEGEKFVTECVVWDKIAADGYLMRYFNHIIYLCEYLEDGLTNQGLELYYRNPQGYGHYLRMCRENHKFTPAVSDFHDAGCYFRWKDQMTVGQIAKLIGTRPVRLLFVSYTRAVKECLSGLKKRVMGRLRGDKS